MESDTNSIVGSQTKSEVKLVLELTDIIDELNSINHLFEAQRDTLDTTVKSFDNSDWFAPEEDRYKLLTEELSTMITQYMESCMKQVKRMTANAQRTKDCVSLWSVCCSSLATYVSKPKQAADSSSSRICSTCNKKRKLLTKRTIRIGKLMQLEN